MAYQTKMNPFYLPANTDVADDEDEDWDDMDEFQDEEETPHSYTARQSPANRPPATPKSRCSCCSWWCILILVLIAGVGGFVAYEMLWSGGEKEGDSKLRVVVLGERHSGMVWLESTLSHCFSDSDLSISSALDRTGFFFQNPGGLVEKNTHVVTVVRDPYDWVELMRTQPMFAPNHVGLERVDFLTRPWTMDRPTSDTVLAEEEGPVCQEGFAFYEVIPCSDDQSIRHDQKAVYELKRDQSGEPFRNILHMRTAKIRNHAFELHQRVESLAIVKYEDMTQSGGVAIVLNHIKEKTGMDYSCDPSTIMAEKSPSHDLLPMEYVRVFNTFSDWEVENKVGYKQWDGPAPGEVQSSQPVATIPVDPPVAAVPADTPIPTSFPWKTIPTDPPSIVPITSFPSLIVTNPPITNSPTPQVLSKTVGPTGTPSRVPSAAPSVVTLKSVPEAMPSSVPSNLGFSPSIPTVEPSVTLSADPSDGALTNPPTLAPSPLGSPTATPSFATIPPKTTGPTQPGG